MSDTGETGETGKTEGIGRTGQWAVAAETAEDPSRDEREFLLRSLEDLDAEFAAGDIDQDDYATLRDQYTHRAAEAIRAQQQNRPIAPRSQSTKPGRQRWLVLAATIAVAAVAGVLLAQAVGYRSPSGEITGGIRQSTAGLLNEADTLGREGRWEDAIDRYEQVLDEDPSNVEALTYLGWVQVTQFGEIDAGTELIGQATAIDPSYPDARVFGSLTARNRGDWQSAAEQLVALDELDSVPAMMQGLIDGADLRAQVAAGLALQQWSDAKIIDIDRIPFAHDVIARAGLRLDDEAGDRVVALALLDAVLEQAPDNRVALIGMGRRLGATPEIIAASPETGRRGLALLDRAVAADPSDVEALVFRALSRALQDQTEAARADLGQIDELGWPEHLTEVVEGLRAGLS